MAKFTFDAEAAIGLDKIGHLDDILELLQKNGDSIYMSEENYFEVDRIEARNKIKKVAKDIIKAKGDDFQKFREKLADMGITISGNDKYVPYIGELTESDYIVTFDVILIKKMKEYKRTNKCSYIPISTIGILKHLYENKVLSYTKYMKIGLKYFKYEGLSNIYEGISKKNWDIKAVRDKFQLYKDPIVESIEKLNNQRRPDIG